MSVVDLLQSRVRYMETELVRLHVSRGELVVPFDGRGALIDEIVKLRDQIQQLQAVLR